MNLFSLQSNILASIDNLKVSTAKKAWWYYWNLEHNKTWMKTIKNYIKDPVLKPISIFWKK